MQVPSPDHVRTRFLDTLPRKLFLLCGQSNMAGRGRIGSSTAPPLLDVLCFAQRQEEWREAMHPLHADKPEKAGVGPGLAFASSILNHAPELANGGIGLLPCAFGGSELARWEVGGDLFEETLRRVERCRKASGPVELAGLLWHQGENDCGDAASAATYAARLAPALDALRAALGDPSLPLVVGELSYDLDQSADDYLYASTINAAIVAAPDRMDACAVISAHGLGHNGDRLHFSAEAAEELGRRYATAWLSLASISRQGRPPLLRGVVQAPPPRAPQPQFCFPTAEEALGRKAATVEAIRD